MCERLANLGLFGAAAIASLLVSCGAQSPHVVTAAALPPAPSLQPPQDGELVVAPGDGDRPSLRLRFAYSNSASIFGFGGVQMWARPERDEIRVSALVDATVKEPRWAECEGAVLFADGERIELEATYMGQPIEPGTYDAVRLDLGVHHLRRLVRARAVTGLVCGDPFELSDGLRRTIGRFVTHFDRIATPRQDRDAPSFREVGPRIELLPIEDEDPGPYEA